MTTIECLAWSVVVVSAVAGVVWIAAALATRLGVALGYAPAWAVLTSIPLLTAASLMPNPIPRSGSKPPEATAGSALDFSLPNFDASALRTGEGRHFTEEELARPIRPDDRKPAGSTWNWSAFTKRGEPAFRAAAPWLAAFLIVGLLAGWLRLALGWNAIRTLARRGRPIEDAELRELLDVLRAELSFTRAVELRECPGLASPAAFGWRRPVVLLPPERRQWSDEERRAVLAHELAHVKRGDYGAWVVAQVCAAAHYFNPVVRGVSQWLRLEQECSADAEAARLAGGRGRYLHVLANLAVRQPDVGAAWPARCFLPTRGSFVRRIEMLRARPPRWSIRTAAGNSMLAAAIAVAGLALATFRPALAAPSPARGEPQPGAGEASPIPVPQTAIAAGYVRLADALKHPQFGKIAADFGGKATFLREKVGLKPEDVDILGVVVLATEHVPDFDGGAVFVGKAALDPSKLFGGDLTITRQAEAGATVFRDSRGIIAILVNEKTLVLPDGPHVGDKVLRAMTGPRHERLERMLGKTGGATLAFATSGSEFFGAIVAKPNHGDEMAANLAKPLVDGQQSMLLKIDVSHGLDASIEAEYATAEGAKTAGQTAQAGITLLGNIARSAASGAPSGDPKQPLLKLASNALGSAKLEVEGARASVKVHVAAEELAGPVAAALAKIQAANRLLVEQNNLKQIALAMHNYASVNGDKFPAASAPEGENKFPVSWRVRILPYIEQEALFREYKFDEPWDGPNNSKLLGKMPNVYRSPAKPSETETPYQVLAGEATAFPPSGGVRILDIADGTSNTILFVESTKQVPWTKPEDVSYPFAGKPALGGVREGGFNIAFADGSVRFVPVTVDRSVLDALATRNGGEVVDHSALDVPRPGRMPKNLKATPPTARP